MSVLAIVVALLAEQWRPLDSRRTVQPVLEAWAGWLEHAFNGGEKSHGMVAWLAAVQPVLEAWAGWLEHAFNGGEKSHGMVAWLAAVLPPAAAAIAIRSEEHTSELPPR